MYTVIGDPRNRASRVLWALEEMGLEWTITLAAPQSDTMRRFNPGGKSPVLMDGEAVIIDSMAAVTYLADKHGKLTHRPGTPDRGRQDSFTFFACDEMDGSLWTAAKHRFALPEALRVPEVKDAARFEWDRACKTLARRFDGPFVTGEMFTIPDLLIGHCAGWAQAAKFDWPDGALGAYFERLMERPAKLRAREKGAAFLPS